MSFDKESHVQLIYKHFESEKRWLENFLSLIDAADMTETRKKLAKEFFKVPSVEMLSWYHEIQGGPCLTEIHKGVYLITYCCSQSIFSCMAHNKQKMTTFRIRAITRVLHRDLIAYQICFGEFGEMAT